MCLIASYPAKEKAEASSRPEPCNLSLALWNTGACAFAGDDECYRGRFVVPIKN
jgi:hypothetical protein